MLAAGRASSTMSRDVKLPMGLGARHSAAASICGSKCIAVTVSQTGGTVRVFREGEIAWSCARSSAASEPGPPCPIAASPPSRSSS